MNIREWLALRTAPGANPSTVVAGGPSFAHVLGWVLVMFLVVEGSTGMALAAFYSPSSNNAWASVAYIQDQMSWGWFVRALHIHAASALVIVSGLHLAQSAVTGAYKKPRELGWWLGIVLMLLVLGFTISGFVLRWDQAGYWANRIEIGIAASTPLVGDAIRRLVIGGNEYGNLTLTRFYTLHVALLPALLAVLAGAHIFFTRRHGVTTRSERAPTPRWPEQSFRNVVAMAAAFAVLVGFTIVQHGAGLAAPADPSSAYDARPLWYFRWLFELRHLAGSGETIAALAAPAIVGGFLVALPFLDRGPERAVRARLPWVGATLGLFALIGILTFASFVSDASDQDLAKREHKADLLAKKVRGLAIKYGVPAAGPQDIYTLVPMWRARTLYAQRCAGCHDEKSKDRKGPVIAIGHGNRAWFTGFLADPSGDHYWGKTKLAKADDAMKPVTLPPPDLSDLAEVLYGESGAADVDLIKRDHGKSLFEKICTDCHSLDEGVAGASGPGLGGLDSRDYFTSFIGNPKSPVHMGVDKSEMPRFDRDLSIVDRDALAEYLIWLRTATQRDVDGLEPL